MGHGIKMKYLNLFRAKKPIAQLSKGERREFSEGLASSILESLINPETRLLAQSMRGLEPENFHDTQVDFMKICETREVLKKIEQETTSKSFERHSLDFFKFLDSIKLIQEKNLVEVSTGYLMLGWINTTISKRSMDLYLRLLEIKSSLQKLDLWTDEMEKAYRDTSFGKAGIQTGKFASCSVLIKQKDRYKLFDSAWNTDFSPLIDSAAYKASAELGSKEIWKALSNGMNPDLLLVFQEFNSWLRFK